MAFSANRPNVMQTSANLYNQAAQGPNINAFQNPYTQQVVDTTMQDMDRGRQMALGQIGAQATQAGAFGGSRHGIAEAETNRGYFDTMGRTMAGLRSDGFNTAMQNAFTNQSNQSQLAGQGFGFGLDVNRQQMQQGALQQALQQQLIDAAKMQYAGFTGAPAAGVGLVSGALGNMPNVGTTTNSSSPGLLGILGGAAQVGGMLGLCWVAREVYGQDDHRWLQFRHWLTTDAPKWLLKAYAKHGKAFAGVVRKVPALKRVLRPLMDRARRAAGFDV